MSLREIHAVCGQTCSFQGQFQPGRHMHINLIANGSIAIVTSSIMCYVIITMRKPLLLTAQSKCFLVVGKLAIVIGSRGQSYKDLPPLHARGVRGMLGKF